MSGCRRRVKCDKSPADRTRSKRTRTQEAQEQEQEQKEKASDKKLARKAKTTAKKASAKKPTPKKAGGTSIFNLPDDLLTRCLQFALGCQNDVREACFTHRGLGTYAWLM